MGLDMERWPEVTSVKLMTQSLDRFTQGRVDLIFNVVGIGTW